MSNIVTEEEARKRWCPETRVWALTDTSTYVLAGNRLYPGPSGNMELVKGSLCVASDCMMWRFHVGPDKAKDLQINTSGWCGRAGNPNGEPR